MSLVEKIQNLHDFVTNNVHLADNDFKLRSRNYNTEVMLGFLNAFLEQKIIYVGEYGLGKTNLCNTISSLAYQIPKESVTNASVKGNPELTAESVIGRPDLGKLNQGNESIIWSNFVLTQPKVIDELNRIPAGKQSMLLSGMQENLWSHLNDNFVSPTGSWFATMNYPDAGTRPVSPALMDRFSLMIEAKSPSLNTKRLIRTGKIKSLKNLQLAKAYDSLLIHNQDDILQLYSNMEAIKNHYTQWINQEFSLELIDDLERKEFIQQVNNVEFSQDAHLFLDFIGSEYDSCQIFGQKRNYEECPEGCHFKNYPCFDVSSGLSVRTENSLTTFSKALAYMDNSLVQPEHVEKIFPFALWHKANVREEKIQALEESKRVDPAKLTYFKKSIRKTRNRFEKLKLTQQEMIKYIINDDVANASKIADKLDHPIFAEYMK